MKNYLFILFYFSYSWIFSQENSKKIDVLDTIHIITTQNKINNPKNYSQALTQKLNFVKVRSSLSSFLTDESDLYIREYGRGMLSSVSIRGTSAAHTQIVWNGIPINSVLNGQTDLNTFYLNNFNTMYLKKGGESVALGSGAIGGAILLSHNILFKKKREILTNFVWGSFQTYNYNIITTISNSKYYFNLSFTGNISENNYQFKNLNQTNKNAEYNGKDFNLNMGYKINSDNQIEIKSQLNLLDRNLSGGIYTSSNAKLLTNQFRNLTSWNFHRNLWNNKLSIAHLFEEYKYFQNKEQTNNFSLSRSKNFIIKNESEYKKNNNKYFFETSFTQNSGIGDAIGKHQINHLAFFASWKKQIGKLNMDWGLRKEFNSLYKIPLIGSGYLEYRFSPKFSTNIRISNNYRVPTFNDLYWNPGGNIHLKPESSYTLEVNQEMKLKKHKLQISEFYIRSNNLIQWKPFTTNLWKPINIQEVLSQGIEFSYENKIKFYKFLLQTKFSYTFQKVMDLNTKKILTYVPQQIGLLKVGIQFKKINASLSNRYAGKVYTTTGNTNYLLPYILSDFKVMYQINKQINLGAGINNLFDTFYETFPSRPQPGRNYYFNINIKIE